MKSLYPYGMALVLCQALVSQAQPHLEEMIVTAPLQKSAAETALPVTVLSGEALRREAASTLGETLNKEMGLASASFGPGVGLPIIRGQGGNRVRVLQDGVGTLDVSAVSPDHGNSVEAIIAERIEVLRGPATLLYGNGAIGGVVNVIDNRIPNSLPDKLKGALEQRHNTVSDEDTSVFKLEGGVGSVAWHVDGLYRDRNNVEIDGYANADDPEDSHHGFIDNSSARAKGLTAGTSWIGPRGFVGVSASRLENNYGLPPGVHEDHDAEHDAGADIRLDMEQTRIDFKGEWQLDGGIEALSARLSHSDYEHRELEIADGETEVGTRFSNEGVEGRLTAQHRELGPFSGVLGIQLGDREFSAIGEEAFIPASDIQSLALFLVESIESGSLSYEFGLRGEHQRIEPESGCSRKDDTLSASASALWTIRDDSNVLVALSRSQRAPTIEESFSNIDSGRCQPLPEADRVEHAATGLLEVGNPDLEKELSHNLDLGLRKHSGRLRGEFNVYYNEIEDFVYLAVSTDPISAIDQGNYRQQTAVFSGFEAELELALGSATDSPLQLSLFSDAVRARFKNGGNVPRIPPRRFGAELSYNQPQWSLGLRTTRVTAQSNTAEGESSSKAYSLVELHGDYHIPVHGLELMLFAKANNLLDEEIRNHSSLLKDVAPEPAMNVELGLRLNF